MRFADQEERLRARLREAVHSVETPPFLEAQLRRRLGEKPDPASRLRPWLPLAVSAAVLLASSVAYQLGHLRFTAAAQDSYIALVGNRVNALMRVGLRDHLHCAHFRTFPKTPPPMTEFVAKMGPEYAPLIPVLERNLPAGSRIELAHRCRYHGRQFVHLAWKDGSGLHSLIVARKQPGEVFDIDGALPALVHSGLTVYRDGARGFQIAAFESRDHLVYSISNESRERTTDDLLKLASGIREVLAKLES
ncbi:MAG: hypothetical protein R2729_02165 [Bryobacteraceae bacterium]